MCWFKRKNKKAAIRDDFIYKSTIKSLEDIERGELKGIPVSYLVFAYNEPELQLRTAVELNNIIEKLDSNQIKKLDLIFRDKTSMEWFVNWRSVNLNLNIPGMTENERITILGLGSFNPNGYFREKCLIQLFRYDNVKAYRFICLRLKDWVFEVRNTAKTLLTSAINTGVYTNILGLIPYLDKIKGSSLKEPGEIENLLTDTLSKDIQSLYKGILDKSFTIKRFCYKVLIQITDDREFLFQRVDIEKDTISKRMLLKKLLENITLDEFAGRVHSLISNRSSEIRIIAMNKLSELKPDSTVEILSKMLIDKNRAVREETRYLIKKIEKMDFRKYYLSHLESIGAVYGVGETGLKEDARILLPFLNSDNTQFICAAICAISNLTEDEYIVELICQVLSKHIGISKKATHVLLNKNYLKHIDRIHQIFSAERELYIRKNCAMLLSSLSKWDAIKYILEMFSDKEIEIVEYAECAYSKWVLKFNCSFRTPTKNQIESFIESLNRYRKYLARNRAEYLEFLISSLA